MSFHENGENVVHIHGPQTTISLQISGEMVILNKKAKVALHYDYSTMNAGKFCFTGIVLKIEGNLVTIGTNEKIQQDGESSPAPGVVIINAKNPQCERNKYMHKIEIL